MTVKELIEALSDVSEDAEVFLMHPETGSPYVLDEVDVEDGFVYLDSEDW